LTPRPIFITIVSLRLITYGTEPMSSTTLPIFTPLPKVELKQTAGLSELGILQTKSQGSGSVWLGRGAGYATKVIDNLL
jgi:hypothetical protein